MRILPYDRNAAVSYARKWALDRNPAYYNFDGIGGDCTNFASQSIYAGAGVMNYTPTFGWYYRSANDRSPSWTGVEYLYDFLVGNEGVGPFARVVSRREAQPGDIVQLGRNGDWYHSLVITETSPAILVSAHTNDALDRPLGTYDYGMSRFLHIEGVRTW